MDRLPETLGGVTATSEVSEAIAGRLKIALVSPYDFAHSGGVTEHVAALAKQLRIRGHEVHIIAPSSDDDTEPDTDGDALVHRIGRVVSIPANGSMARITLSLRSYLQAKRLLNEEQFDLIHLHEPLMPALPLTVLRHSRAVNIGTFHAYQKKPLTYFYAKPIMQFFFKKLHGHIVVSDAARAFIGEYFPAAYRVIPNGIDFARFYQPTGAQPRSEDGRPTVLFVGRLDKRKGLRYLLRAWPLVLARCPAARLVIVGAGRPLEGYRRFARRQGWSEEDVRLAGHVPPEDLPGYYRAATLFCAPSTGQESFGIVLLEAMAAGAPIVATSIPGYSAVITHEAEGLLVPPKEARELADAIVRLIEDPSLRRRMQEAGQRTAQAYDWQSIAVRILAYYDEVVARCAEKPKRPGARFARMRRVAGLLTSRP